MSRAGFAGRRNLRSGTYCFIVGEAGQALSLRLAPGDICPAEGCCFNWGCSTPAAGRLSRAILWSSVKDTRTVEACWEAFVNDVVARLPVMEFHLHACSVGDWLVAIAAELWCNKAMDDRRNWMGGAR